MFAEEEEERLLILCSDVFPLKKRTTTDRLRVLLFFAGKRSIVP